MSKKAKKRKSRRLSSSSSEDVEKKKTSKKETSKRKHASSDKKNDVTVKKTPVPSSSEKETQGKREVKKPVYKMEKTKSKRGQSPIFKEEERKNRETKHSLSHRREISSKSKISQNSSSQDRWVASSSRDIFLPRSVSIEEKNEGQRTPVKRCRAVSPHCYAPKAKEAKKSPFVPQVIPSHHKDGTSKKSHHHREQKSSKAKMNSTLPAFTPSLETASTSISSKAEVPLGPQQLRKKIQFTIVKKTEDKFAKSDHQQRKHNDYKPSCEAKLLCNAKPSLQQSKIPATVPSKEISTASVSSDKTVKAFPGSQMKKCATVLPLAQSMLPNFRIPKKTDVPESSSAVDNKSLSLKTDRFNLTCEATTSFPQSSSSTTAFSNQDVDKQETWPPPDVSSACHADSTLWQDQTLVVEQLHQARSEKLLEVNVMQSYGELTCMEVDPPEERPADTKCKELPQQDVIIVLDTNILISHLDYVKRIVSRGLEVVSSVVLIPWVVLQELDSLKKGRGVSNSVAHSAIPAISYIYNCLKGKESRLLGQSMQQAAESTNSLNVENNDDRVLQCCLQYQLLYPECAVILCTNDKNLCSKALLSGVKAFSKIDLETEVARFSQRIPLLQNLQAPITPKARCSISAPVPDNVHAQNQETTSLSVEKEINQPQEANAARRSSCHLSSVVCQFERVLQEALSHVLEAEMRAAYEDLWLEIVYRKPPWSLSDVLMCLKKHWIAVFGHVVSRDKEQNVLNLITFFTPGKDMDHDSTVEALVEAKVLLKEFANRSSHVSSAISAVDSILSSLQTQGESSGSDVVMEAEEDKRATSPPMSHAEVWALFGNIWQHVYQTSLEVFKAVDFDPKSSQRVQLTGGAPPPQEALACLHKLLCLVSQLLQAFSSFLTPALAEAHSPQSLLRVMQSTEIINVDKLTTTDLLNCFAQEEYRERLRTGGSQLLELQAALSCCMDTVSGHMPFTVQP